MSNVKKLVDVRSSAGYVVDIIRRSDTPHLHYRFYVDVDRGGVVKTVRKTGTARTADRHVAMEIDRVDEFVGRKLAGMLGGAGLAALRERVKHGYVPTGRECLEVYENSLSFRRKRETSFRYWLTTKSALSALYECMPGLDNPVVDFTSESVSTYCARRAEGGFTTTGPTGKKTSERGPAGPHTVHGELGVFGRAVSHALNVTQHKGKRFSSGHPIYDVKNTTEGKAVWPRKETQNAPILSDERLLAMVSVADEQEKANWSLPHMPRGYLKTHLLLMAWTGRRRGHVRGLQIGDIAFAEEEVRTLLVRCNLPEEWARDWKFGAVLFVDERYAPLGTEREKLGDKRRRMQIVPLSKRLRDLLLTYLRSHPARDNSEAWLFPLPKNPVRPAGAHNFYEWFLQLERRAGLKHYLQGGDHMVRRYFRSGRARHVDNKLLGLLSGWTNASREAMNGAYLQYGPVQMLKAMELQPAMIEQEEGLVPGIGVRVDIPVDDGIADPMEYLRHEIGRRDVLRAQAVGIALDQATDDELEAALQARRKPKIRVA